MVDENPYRYEGTLENPGDPALAKKIKASQVMNICWKGLIIGAIVGATFGFFIDSLEATLIISMFVLIPICVFGVVLYRKRNVVLAQLGYWVSAAPLAILLIWMLFDNSVDDIGRIGLIGYLTQLIPAILTMLYFSKIELSMSRKFHT